MSDYNAPEYIPQTGDLEQVRRTLALFVSYPTKNLHPDAPCIIPIDKERVRAAIKIIDQIHERTH